MVVAESHTHHKITQLYFSGVTKLAITVGDVHPFAFDLILCSKIVEF